MVKSHYIKRSWPMTILCLATAGISGGVIYSLVTSYSHQAALNHYGIILIVLFSGIFISAFVGAYYGSKARIYQALDWIIGILSP